MSAEPEARSAAPRRKRSLAEIACEQLYPGQRLVACRNPLVAEERARKRQELLQGTEKDLGEIKRRVQAGTLQGQAEIGLQVGGVWNRYMVTKHFQVTITDDTFTYERKHEQIAQEAELDGISVIRAGRIAPAQLAAAGIVRAYKQLKEAEKGFGGLKGPLEVRPIYHRLTDRVRSHLLICMLAEYVRWHLRHAWAELLFQDDNPRSNADPVAKATRSPDAIGKAGRRRTPSRSPATRSRASSTSSRTAPATPSVSRAARRPSRS